MIIFKFNRFIDTYRGFYCANMAIKDHLSEYSVGCENDLLRAARCFRGLEVQRRLCLPAPQALRRAADCHPTAVSCGKHLHGRAMPALV